MQCLSTVPGRSEPRVSRRALCSVFSLLFCFTFALSTCQLDVS